MNQQIYDQEPYIILGTITCCHAIFMNNISENIITVSQRTLEMIDHGILNTLGTNYLDVLKYINSPNTFGDCDITSQWQAIMHMVMLHYGITTGHKDNKLIAVANLTLYWLEQSLLKQKHNVSAEKLLNYVSENDIVSARLCLGIPISSEDDPLGFFGGKS